MARRAVQGYTEKSYYENTRYTGLVATTDPLNEGFFKQLVNLDISDTGQSVKPRKGFLTTTLKDDTGKISLSSQTIVFKDRDIQAHIVYDFTAQKGYIVDIDASNIEDNMFPIVSEIANYDWSDVFTYFIREESSFAGFYASAPSTAEGDLLSILKPYTDTITKSYTDEALIDKQLLKAYVPEGEGEVDLEEDHPFMLAIYYRENANASLGLDADTLIFSVVDTAHHPTYDSTQRNIACSKSIIPDPIQTIHDEDSSPAGHINTVWPALFVKDENDKYPILQVNKNKPYTFTPHYNLKHAEDVLNPVTPGSAHWAYMFEVINTDNLSPEDALWKPIRFRSNWYTFDETEPEEVAPLFERDEGENLDALDIEERHYKDATIVITVVGSAPHSNPEDSNGYYISDSVGDTTTHPDLDEGDKDFYTMQHGNAVNIINSVNNTRDIVGVVEALSSGGRRFHVHDLQTGNEFPRSVPGFYSDIEDENIFEINKVEDYASRMVAYDELFANAETLISRIKTGVYKNKQFVFRVLPLAFIHKTIGATLSTFELVFTTISDYTGTLMNGWGWDEVESPLTLLTRNTVRFDGLSEIDTYNTTDGIVSLTTDAISNLAPLNFFRNGYHINFYMKAYEESDVENWDTMSVNERRTLLDSWATTPFVSTSNYSYATGNDTITYTVETLTKEPAEIKAATNHMVYNGNRGDHHVVWYGNTLYISEPGKPYYYKDLSKRRFGEQIVKVVQFKTILMVFTVQHLYAVYEIEQVEKQTVDEQEIDIYTYVWGAQRVLYNILTNPKYADVIQVFNQMVLFYSEDGQMFMIKPNTMIDSETRFTLQYFNKSANDILKNYDVYINERLKHYLYDHTITKNDVSIKALLSVNFIKIFYSVPDYLTYILVYDVINNRYYTYDTCSFTSVLDKGFIKSGECYLTEYDSKMYLTTAYKETCCQDNMVDMSIVTDFKKVPIYTLLDPGVLNLNNHLRKRFRDLYIIFKNLSAEQILYNVEVFIDDVPVLPEYHHQLEMRDFNGAVYLLDSPSPTTEDVVDLLAIDNVFDTPQTNYATLDLGPFREGNTLFNFTENQLSKLLTHKASILNVGKTLQLKMHFVSRGDYKLQSFGIIYKERRV